MNINAQVTLDPFSDIEAALRRLKKAMGKDGLFKEMRRKEFYLKPSERKRRKRAEAQKRARKAKKKHIARRDQGYDEDRKPNHFNGDYVQSPNYRGRKS